MTTRLKVILIVLVVVGVLYLAIGIMANRSESGDNRAVSDQSPVTGQPNQPDDSAVKDDADPIGQQVAVSQTFVDGTYTLRGTLSLPTPCHTLTYDVRVMESYPEQVVIAFTSKSPDVVCVQVIDERPFVVIFNASEQASIRGTLNGQPLTLQIIKQ
ncbi:MAG: hypothetical protein HY461_03405 [Parcubacteria group bacterium]|nr:hypothetical protein [Parcubacteria group bacterium]